MRPNPSPGAVASVALLVVSVTVGAAAAAGGAQEGSRQPATHIVVGAAPPSDLALQGIDGGRYAISEADGPLLLLFFRGAW